MAGDGAARCVEEGSIHRRVFAISLTSTYLSYPANTDLGLSNFNMLKIKRVLEVAKIIPAVNQVEIHP